MHDFKKYLLNNVELSFTERFKIKRWPQVYVAENILDLHQTKIPQERWPSSNEKTYVFLSDVILTDSISREIHNLVDRTGKEQVFVGSNDHHLYGYRFYELCDVILQRTPTKLSTIVRMTRSFPADNFIQKVYKCVSGNTKL